jgi:hypothetical protein
MKLLMFYVEHWWYRTASKSLPEAPEAEGEETVDNAAVVFFHVEAKDEKDRNGTLKKFLKNTKWLAGKFDTKNVVFHSFNHLGMSKSSPEFARDLRDEAVERLEKTGFSVMCTPFGYFNEFKMHVAGDSLAKVFKEF